MSTHPERNHLKSEQLIHTALAAMTSQDDRGILAAVSWLKDEADVEGIGLVFKMKDINIDGIEITWTDFSRKSKQKDIADIAEAHIRAVPCIYENQPTTKSQLVVSNLLATVQKCLFDFFQRRNLEPEDIVLFVQGAVGGYLCGHVHVLLHIKENNNKNAKRTQKRLTIDWKILAENFFGQQSIEFRKLVESNEWVDLLCYKNNSTKKQYVREVNPKEYITNYFLHKESEYLNSQTFYSRSTNSKNTIDYLNYESRLQLRKQMLRILKQEKTGENNNQPTIEITELQAKKVKSKRTKKKKKRTEYD